ncbi:diguanylate cyclase [Pseudomonas indica]|uniref:diguanylate cyclase n=1 Tax=Pseudomonas indica TaxID=137658 RepID=UPI003FD4698F
MPVLPAVGEKNQRFIRRPRAAWLVASVALLGGALLTASVIVVTQDIHQRQIRQRFELVASERFSRTQERFDDQVLKLDSLRRFMLYAGEIVRADFTGYARPLLNGTLSYSWGPRILAGERAAFEKQVRDEGIVGFAIEGLDEAGARYAMPERAEYFPVLFNTARRRALPLIGVDMASEAARRAVLERAVTSGEMVVSDPVHLAQSTGDDRSGLIMLVALYPGPIAPATAEQRREQLRGFVMASISLEQLMEEGLTEESSLHLAAELTDMNGASSRKALYRSLQEPADSPLRISRTLRLADHYYELNLRPTQRYLLANQASGLGLLATLGALLSLLFSAFCYSLVSQRQRALALVDERTADLRLREEELAVSEERWSFALDGAGHGVWDWNLDSGEVFFSRAWGAMLGYAEGEVENNRQAYLRLLHPEDASNCEASLARYFSGETAFYQDEHRMLTRDGRWLWVQERGKAVERDEEGAVRRLIGTQTDISARKTAELELARANAQLRGVLNAATQVAIIATDLEGVILTFNVGAERMLGYRALEMIGQWTPERLFLADELQARGLELSQRYGRTVVGFEILVAEAVEEGSHEEREWTWLRRDGSRLAVNLIVTGVHDAQGRLVGYLAIALDTTERKRVREALEARDRLLEKLTSRVPGVIYQYQRFPDGRDRMPYVSAAVRTVYELEPEHARQNVQAMFRRVHPEDQERVYTSILRSARDLTPWREDYRLLLPRQGLRWVRGESVPERQPDGSTLWYGYISDITGLKLVEEELRALSITDALTGTYNRRYFQERLETEIARAERQEGPLALIMLDIDHFKQINDRHGHEAGDRVLREVCRRISQRLRRIDVFCRLGGEEFIVLCPDTGSEQAGVLAEALWQSLRREPVEGIGIVTASFGIANWHEGEGADALLRRVDVAVYRAKQKGRDRIEQESLELL